MHMNRQRLEICVFRNCCLVTRMGSSWWRLVIGVPFPAPPVQGQSHRFWGAHCLALRWQGASGFQACMRVPWIKADGSTSREVGYSGRIRDVPGDYPPVLAHSQIRWPKKCMDMAQNNSSLHQRLSWRFDQEETISQALAMFSNQISFGLYHIS